MNVYITAKVRNFTNPFTRYTSIENTRRNRRFVPKVEKQDQFAEAGLTETFAKRKQGYGWRLKQLGYAIVALALPLKPMALISFYALPFVVASVLSTQETTAQTKILDPKGNQNIFTSQDTTTTAKKYNILTTKDERDEIIDLRVQGDWVKDVPSRAYWNCNQSSLQLLVNSHDWGKEDTYYGGRLFYNDYDGSEKDTAQLYLNGGTLKDMGKLGLPTHSLSLYDAKTMPKGHGMNAIITGDTITNWNSWNMIEPQLGVTNAKIGKIFSLPENCEEASIMYTYLYEDANHKKNFGLIEILRFKIVNSKATLTYNINNDTQMVYNGDNLDPNNPKWTIPLNERVHIFETRQDAITANKTLTLENIAKIYPNPATNYINIEIPGQPKKIDAKIYSIDGKLLNEKTIENNKQVNTENLREGMYLVRVTDGIRVYNGKFVKQ